MKWAPETGQGEREDRLRLWVCVEDSGPGMATVGLEGRGLAPPGARLKAERAGFIPAHQQPLIPLASSSQGLPRQAVTYLVGRSVGLWKGHAPFPSWTSLCIPASGMSE